MRYFEEMAEEVSDLRSDADDMMSTIPGGPEEIQYVFESSSFGDPEKGGYMQYDPARPAEPGTMGADPTGMDPGNEDDQLRQVFIEEMTRTGDDSERYQQSVVERNGDERVRIAKMRNNGSSL